MASEEEKVWKLLECPVCYEVVVPPIYMCKEGHHICNVCKEKCFHCPQCRAEITTTRNYTTESIVKTISLPCPNRVYGCLHTTNLEARQQHKTRCPYNPFKCPIDDCRESVGKNSVVEHFKTKHFAPSMENLSTSGVARWMWVLNKTIEHYLCICEISNWGSFLYQEKKDPSHLSVHWLQYFGTKEEASSFTYELSLKERAGQKFTFSGNMESITLTFDELKATGNYLVVGGKLKPEVESRELTITIKKTDPRVK